MQGGVILFRGTGADALRYVESDRSRADDYYLGTETAVAQLAALDGDGTTTAELSLDPETYAGWVDWTNPLTGEQMGRPRQAGAVRKGSPRFAEMVINAPKSLSVAAALHPEVSDALDRAQQDALSEIRRWVAQHSVTRVGPLGRQEVVPATRMQVVGISHRTSRAGDPHRHIHMQIGTRVFAAGKWRALDTAALFRQQGAIRALGTAVIAAHPELADVLDWHGLTLDPATGEVVELEPFNTLMSKRGEQVRRNLERLEAEWEATHPGETMGPVVSSRLTAQAWAYERPAKKPTTLGEEAAWLTELRDAGYDPATLRRPASRTPVALDELSVQEIASRALDRCAAAASTWTRHTVQEHATRIITEAGVRASGDELRELIGAATTLALEDSFSVLPPDAVTPEHVAHLTSLRVVQAETELRDLITARTPESEPNHPDVSEHAAQLGQDLDPDQMRAAAAVASTDPLVIVEGAAGSGKTTMLATAIRASEAEGRAVRVVAPTKRAAEVAHQELGVPAESVAALVHAHGWRWNDDGVWTRLTVGDTDPMTGATYTGPPQTARLRRGERIVVDEAGMLDQDTAFALFTVAEESGATLTLVGDRAQLPAVGRGGVLDMAASLRGRTFDMAEVHRFTDPEYTEVTVRMRDRRDLGAVFDQLQQLGLVRLHTDADEVREHIAVSTEVGEVVTVSSNDDAARFNDRIRDERTRQCLVDDTATATGSDGLSIGRGDLIQTRQNDTALGVANRQQWIVQHVEPDGSLWARDAHSDRKREHSVHLPAEYVREHAHLSYAATAYGVQGVTAPASHTILTEQTSGAGLYVGMTRGREANTLHVIAENEADARQQFIDAMERDRADRGLTDATQHAAEAVRGLIDNGPVKLVNAEIAALTAKAEHAEQRAALWQQAADALTDLHAQQRDTREQAIRARDAGAEQVEQVRAEVATPLTEQASAALADWRDADTARRAARDRLSTVGWLGKRRATTEHDTAQALARDAEQQLTRTWGEPPRWTEDSASWVERVTRLRIDADPRVIEATEQQDAAVKAVRRTLEPGPWPRLRIYARIFGAETVAERRTAYLDARPHANAKDASRTAQQARAEIETLRALTPAEAVQRIQQTRATEQARREAAERALNERQRQLDPSHTPDRGPSHGGPSLGR